MARNTPKARRSALIEWRLSHGYSIYGPERPDIPLEPLEGGTPLDKKYHRLFAEQKAKKRNWFFNVPYDPAYPKYTVE